MIQIMGSLSRLVWPLRAPSTHATNTSGVAGSLSPSWKCIQRPVHILLTNYCPGLTQDPVRDNKKLDIFCKFSNRTCAILQQFSPLPEALRRAESFERKRERERPPEALWELRERSGWDGGRKGTWDFAAKSTYLNAIFTDFLCFLGRILWQVEPRSLKQFCPEKGLQNILNHNGPHSYSTPSIENIKSIQTGGGPCH